MKEEYKDKNWKGYNKRYALDHQSLLQHWEFRDIINLINRYGRNKDSLLDFGCNTGDFCNYAKKEINFKIIFGIDINREAINLARKKYPKYDFSIGSFEKIKGKYDIITAIEVIEHIRDTRDLLKNLKTKLKKRGILIVSCPNKWAIMPKIGGFFIREKFCYDPTHVHEFSPLTLKREFEKSRFKVLKITSKPLGIPLLQHISRKLKENMPGFLFGSRLYLVATK